VSSPLDRSGFETERANPDSAELDRLPLEAAFDLVNAEDQQVARAVAAARPEIVRAIVLIAERLARGGRLFYVGAGTSGRLGVLDAAECPPTFQSDPRQVQGVIAGGLAALTAASEGAEDSRADGQRELFARELAADDVVFGIAAGGTTPFVHGALDAARERGAGTVFLACVPREQAGDAAEVSIRVVTGPEVVAGSTRLKAGTATKMVLNCVSTLVMVRLGKVHGNLMVDVHTRGNRKLWQRGIQLVTQLTGRDAAAAEALLRAAAGQVKVAVVMGRLDVDADEARRRLAAARGFLRPVLEQRS